ncbi:MAG: shikimate kinase, partial [Bacteroides sp.]
KSGLTLFLEVSKSVLFERLKLGRRKRPKLQGKNDDELLAFISEGLDERLPIYQQADYRIGVDDLDSLSAIDQCVSAVVKLIGKQVGTVSDQEEK